MEKEPTEVHLIGKEGDDYLIQFPNLKVPVKVNNNLYIKMKHSRDYVFSNSGNVQYKTHSA
ncbi:hypothetical protein [Flavisericum labens]|uniref:hypothetical protein n=1 Tax=Flavisericum labens TaxID=3377112 RepID=UPI00387B1182